MRRALPFKLTVVKALLAAALLMLVVAAPASSAGFVTGDGTWQWANPSPQGNPMKSVSFVDANTGWAAGVGGTILKTTDGGASWTPQVPASSCAGIVTSGCDLNSVSFLNAANGLAVGDYGIIWKTVDGGASWTAPVLPSSGCGSCASTQLTSVKFIDANNVVAVGAGYAFYSSDGGATWNLATGIDTSVTLNSVSMSGATGWAVGSSGAIYKTTDYGHTWPTKQTSPVSLSEIRAVYTVDLAHAFAVSGNQLFRTSDGVNWAASGGLPAQLYGVTYSGNTLLATGSGGAIFKRSAASNWSDSMSTVGAGMASMNSNTTSLLFAAAYVGGNDAFAVGDAGTILKSGDFGNNWGFVAGGNARTFMSSSFISDTTGWAVSREGAVIKTTDGGATWASDASGIAASTVLQSVQFLDATTGFAVGYSGSNGVAYKYSSGTWTSMVLPVSPANGISQLWGIHMVDATHGWTVGFPNNGSATSGIALKTTDGSTWSYDTGTGTVATATATVTTDVVSTINVSNWGSGYTSAPTVNITSGGGTGASATASISNGHVTAINVITGGSGYTAPPSVSLIGGGGTGATASATVTGPVTSIAVTGGGSGFTSTPSVAIAGGGGTGATATATVSAGSVTAVNITNGGAGYSAAPKVSIVGGGFIGSNIQLYSVDATTQSDGWVVGQETTAGTAVVASFSGGTWTVTEKAELNGLQSIDMVSALNGYAAGYGPPSGSNYGDGKVYKTTDGGVTWNNTSLSTTHVMSAVSFIDASTGYVAGGEGRLFKTIDGGTTWTLQSTGTGVRLYTLSTVPSTWAASGYAAFVAGDSAAILRSPQPPEVTSVSTAGVEVHRMDAISATFSKDLNSATISSPASSFKITPQGGSPIAGSIVYDAPTRKATFTPSSPLAEGTTYNADISTAVTDPAGNHMVQNYSWTFAVVNRPPVLNPIGDKSMAPGGTLSFEVSGSDPDGDALTYSATNLPSGATFDPGTRIFSWTPSPDQGGSFPNVTFTVTDNGTPNLSASEAITISVKRDYLWTWYDNVNGANWILMANPFGSGQTQTWQLKVGGTPLGLPNGGAVGPGQTITPRYGGVIGGPVDATSMTGVKGIASQRILWAGNSLEEVPGTEAGKLSSHFWWTWYDQASAGYTDWVLVANPSTTDTVYYRIKIANVTRQQGILAPGQNVIPTFGGVIGGPVEVQAWTGGYDSTPANVMASQRVLSNGGSAFNEVPGTADADLSSDYLWTWYDNVGGKNWVLIANPPTNSEGLYYQIFINNSLVSQGGPIAPGSNVKPTFGGVVGGPVEVKTFKNNDPGQPLNSIASQRVIWGPSFEEVPGTPRSTLATSYHWTWYDQAEGPGVTNWVLVGNPSGSASIYYEVKVAGTVRSAGTLAPGQQLTPTFNGVIGGPVQVSAWDHAGGTAQPVMASQRVLWNSFFNETLGMNLN